MGPKEMKEIAQGHRACKWQGQGDPPGLCLNSLEHGLGSCELPRPGWDAVS